MDAAQFHVDRRTVYAVTHAFEIVGEAAKGIPDIPETRDYVKAILEKVGIKRLDPPSIPMPKPIEN